MPAMARTLVAVNTAPHSENQMHGEAARRFGFTGGLVPGVDVLGYLAHEGVDRWGAPWLAGGRFTGRLIAPVYDGETVRIVTDDVDADRLAARVLDHDDAVRAEATMSLLDMDGSGEETKEPGRSAVLRRADPSSAPVAPLPDRDERPPASRSSLAVGTPTATMRSGFHAEHARHYLAQISETHPLFCEEGLAQPAWLLTLANFALAATVRLGPWIHVGSDLWMLEPVRDGEEIEVRGVVTDCYERKGHEFVDLQVCYLREGAPVALADHRAIWRPRAGAEGS
jgi:acyl dehydratase